MRWEGYRRGLSPGLSQAWHVLCRKTKPNGVKRLESAKKEGEEVALDVFLISSFHRLSVQPGWSTPKAAEEGGHGCPGEEPPRDRRGGQPLSAARWSMRGAARGPVWPEAE